MKRLLFILTITLTCTFAVRGQSAVSTAVGMAKEIAAQKAQLSFNAEVSGQYLIINFDNLPQTAFEIEIYDITGKRVASFKSDKATNKRMEFSFNQNLSSGLYIIRITSGTQAAAKKFQV